MARRQVTDIEQYRRQKRRAGNFRWILIALFFLVCACAGYFFSLSSFFAITVIDVRGNAQVSEARLQSLTGIEIGQNLLLIDTDYTEQLLRIHPYVAEATVERRFPNTVVVEIEEREAVAVLATGLAFVKIDREGLVLERTLVLDNVDLPILSGVGKFPAGILPGSYIESEKIGVALQVLNSLPRSALTNVTEINVSDTQKIRLYTPGSVELRLGGPTNLVVKYVLAANIADYLYQTGRAAGILYVDVSSDKPVVMPKY